jgi:hypothetical protein
MTDALPKLAAGDEQPLHTYKPIRRPQHFYWLLPAPLPVLLVLLVILIGGNAFFVISGLVLAAAAAAIPALAYWFATVNNDLRIDIYPDRISHFQGGERTEIFWRELKDVRLQNYRTPRKGFFIGLTEIILIGIGGKEVTIGAFVKDADMLTTIISEVVRMYQMPDKIDALKAGKTVHFGAIAISAEGLHAAGRTLPWGKLAYDLLEGHRGLYRVIAYTDRPLDLRMWFTARLRDIENVPLLMALVNHYDQFTDAESTLHGTPSIAQLAAETTV